MGVRGGRVYVVREGGTWRDYVGNWSKLPFLGTFWENTTYWSLQSYYFWAAP